MTSSRRFIQGMAALAPGLTLGEAFGASPDDAVHRSVWRSQEHPGGPQQLRLEPGRGLPSQIRKEEYPLFVPLFFLT